MKSHTGKKSLRENIDKIKRHIDKKSLRDNVDKMKSLFRKNLDKI
jgi:hypothetical protein